MSQVDVSKYNCDSVALESLPLDKNFGEDFQNLKK